jgi:hypothetical protein
MTERRDLKRRVRERQARTGESYMTALRHVQAQRPAAIPMIELIDLTERGAALGLACRIAMFPRLAERVDAGALLGHLRDALLATEGDRALALMRGVVLRGERARMPVTGAAFDEARRFVARAKAGIGGVSERGRMLAMQAPGRPDPQMVLFLLQLTPDFVPVHRDPTLVITSVDGLTVDPLLGVAEEAP